MTVVPLFHTVRPAPARTLTAVAREPFDPIGAMEAGLIWVMMLPWLVGPATLLVWACVRPSG